MDNSEYGVFATNLWQKHFKMYELHEIIRQRDLFLALKEKEIQACGTVGTNRKGLPKEIMVKKTEVKALERGQSLFQEKGDLVAVTWQDRKLVHLISTVPVGDSVGKVNH